MSKHNKNDKFPKEVMQAYGELMSSAIPKGTGFALMLFPLDTEGPTNRIQYISNANRADMINAIEGCLQNLKRGN